MDNEMETGFDRDLQPSGSKDANNRALGPKYYNIICTGALKPYYMYLGPWTLSVGLVLTILHDSKYSKPWESW